MVIAQPDIAVTTPGNPVHIPVLANDSGSGLAIIGLTLPINGTVNVDPLKSITYLPEAGFSGTDSLAYTVRGSDGSTASAVVTIHVQAANHVPVAVDDMVEVEAGQFVDIAVVANDNDADGDPLTLMAVVLPANGMLQLLAGQKLRYTPKPGFVGEECFSYTISDGHGGQDKGDVFIRVRPANTAPVAADDDLVVEAGQSTLLGVLANDNDPEGSPLEIRSFTQPAHGSLVLEEDGSLRYTPDGDYAGIDGFSYTIGDDGGLEDTASVALTVEPVDPSGFVCGQWLEVPSRGVALGDVVMLVDETHTGFRLASEGGCIHSPAGADIRFEDLASAAELSREILHYDGANGRVIAAVRLGELSPATTRSLRLLAGSAVRTGSNNGVWAGYLGAWSGTDGRNLAGNAALDLTPSGLVAGTSCPFAAGFDGNAHASHADGGFLAGLGEIEICALVKSAATGIDARILAQGPHTGAQGAHGLLLTYDAVGYQGGAANVITAVITTDAGVVRLESEAGMQTTDLQHIAVRWKSGAPITMEIDGVAIQPSWAGTIVNGVATAGATLSGNICLPMGTFELGGLATDPWVGEIGLVTLRADAAGAVRGLFDGSNRVEPRSVYGASLPVALPEAETPPIAPPTAEVPPASPPVAPPAGGDELPVALRKISVANRTQLDNALAAALPGDEILLADGTYGSTPIKPTRSGTAEHPIVIRATNCMGAMLPGGFDFPESLAWVVLAGLDLTSANSILRGTSNRITRCRIKPPVNVSGASIGIAVRAGRDCRIDHCNITFFSGAWQAGALYSGIRGQGSGTNLATHMVGLRIDHNHFHDAPAQIKYNQPYFSPVISAQNVTESEAETAWVYEYNLFERCNTTSVIGEFKSSANICRFNHFLNSNGYFAIRQGHGNQFYGNTMDNCKSLYIARGPGHLVHGNRFINGSKYLVLSGHVPADVFSNSVPASKNARLVSNEGPVTVGETFNTYTIAPTGTVIEAHVGGEANIRTENGASYSWHAGVQGGLQVAVPVAVSASEVGIDAS